MKNNLQALISKNRVWYCLDCGKCGAVCPVARWEKSNFTSPRLLIEKSIQGRAEELMDDPLFWSCLICKRCSELCPSDVHFVEFLRDLRQMARNFDRKGDCTHSEMIQTWGRMMTNPDLHQKRLGWLSDDLIVSKDSDTVFFVGCLPYFAPVFNRIGVEGAEIARAAIKILNRLGIEPQVLPNERCCGHDQLWEGDIETFRALAALNLEMFQSCGAKRIITTCPECARTLKIDYPQFFGNHSMEVLHLTELLAASDLADLLRKAKGARRITYQDPCNLGRHLGVYDAPRKVMTDLGYELLEMKQNRSASLCCGASCWRACGSMNKQIQLERLEEAKRTGAELLVTACLKCQIHLKCAQNDPIRRDEIDIEIRDLTTLVAENL